MLLGHHRASHDDRGLSSVEYSLATVGVVGLLVTAVLGLGEHLAAAFDCMSGQLNGWTAACGAPTSPGGPSGDLPGDPDSDEGQDLDGTGGQPGPTSTLITTDPGTPTNPPTGTPTSSSDPTPSPNTSGSTTTNPSPEPAS